jgi:N-acetylmuramoyl-L-alanine amidase
VLSFGYFSLHKQRKVTRAQARKLLLLREVATAVAPTERQKLATDVAPTKGEGRAAWKARLKRTPALSGGSFDRIDRTIAHNPAMPLRIVCTALLCLLLAACAHAPRNPLATWVPSKNFNARKPNIIVLHSTEQGSVAESLDTLRSENSGGKVSAHYLVGDDGRIYQLVSDLDRAWHAGAGRWGTITELNSASIGIEIDNQRGEAFTGPQIAALLRLLDDLTARHGIPKTQVIAHADMAPTRKRDPGALFPWKRLADAGFGLWPRTPLVDPPPGFDPWLAMARVGYPLDDRAAAVRAFHRHYRGRDDGDDASVTLDAEDARILHALVAGDSALRATAP